MIMSDQAMKCWGILDLVGHRTPNDVDTDDAEIALTPDACECSVCDCRDAAETRDRDRRLCWPCKRGHHAR